MACSLATVVLGLLALVQLGTCALYQDQSSNPFEQGPLSSQSVYIEENWIIGPDMDVLITYPDQPEPGTEYSVILFMSGFYGQVESYAYTEMLTLLASHGYVVVAPWPLFDSSTEAIEGVMNWVADNLAGYVSAQPSWENFGITCHSAGCDTVRDILRERPEFANTVKGVVMIEPASFFLDDPEPHSVPGLMYAGELAAAGSCSVDGMDYRAFYNVWQCPKYLMVAEKYGHCDMMNDEARDECSLLCDEGPDEDAPFYRLYMQGLLAAFLNTYAQGNPSFQPFLSDASTHPLQLLAHEQTLEC